MSNKRDELFERILRYLKEIGIDDPNIDLFLSVIEDDVDKARKALDNGANPNVTDYQIINRYQDYLRKEPMLTIFAEWLIESTKNEKK